MLIDAGIYILNPVEPKAGMSIAELIKILGIPNWIAADTKYGSEECLKYLQDKNIKTAIRPETKSSKPDHFSKSKFKYNNSTDCYICPNGKVLKRRAKNYTHNRIAYKSNKKDCNLCPVKEKCISGKASFRTVSHYDSPCYDRARSWYYSGCEFRNYPDSRSGNIRTPCQMLKFYSNKLFFSMNLLFLSIMINLLYSFQP